MQNFWLSEKNLQAICIKNKFLDPLDEINNNNIE